MMFIRMALLGLWCGFGIYGETGFWTALFALFAGVAIEMLAFQVRTLYLSSGNDAK